MGNKPQQANTSDVIKVRYEKLQALREAGRDPFVITTSDRDVYTATVKEKFEEYENKDVCVAGRIMSKRGKGKVSFLDLHDKTGKIQIFAKFDDLGEEEYGFLKKWDIGDIVEVKGFVFKTQMGEISVHAKAVRLLSKSLKPLPEKYHGLTNTDLRYRQRYVDLIHPCSSPTPAALRLVPSSPTLTLLTRSSSCASRSSFTSKDLSSAASSASTRLAGFSATRALTPVTIPSSP